jgi:muramoyltetrapeptide carboxypeptidase
MRREMYMWSPAYSVANAEQLQRTRANGRWLAECVGASLTESERLGDFLPPGSWRSDSDQRPELDRVLDCQYVVAARGGYGSMELATALLRSPKTSAGVLIGYSDLTILHACWRIRGWGESLYGYLAGMNLGERARSSTKQLITGGGLRLDHHSDAEVARLSEGRAHGTCFAACLRVLAGLVGTPAMPHLDGCILALEDIDERPYQIDRDLQQLFLSGALADVRGLVFGRFPAPIVEGYQGPSAQDICLRWAKRLGVPAIAGLRFGHEDDPLTLPCGRAAEFEVTNSGWTLDVKPRS